MFFLQVHFKLKDKKNQFLLRGQFLSSKSSDLKIQSAPLTRPRLNLYQPLCGLVKRCMTPPNRIAGRSELK